MTGDLQSTPFQISGRGTLSVTNGRTDRNPHVLYRTYKVSVLAVLPYPPKKTIVGPISHPFLSNGSSLRASSFHFASISIVFQAFLLSLTKVLRHHHLLHHFLLHYQVLFRAAAFSLAAASASFSAASASSSSSLPKSVPPGTWL